MIIWVEQGQVLEKAETRGKAREVLVACSMFDPQVFKMFTKAANRNWIGEVLLMSPRVNGIGGMEFMSSLC